MRYLLLTGILLLTNHFFDSCNIFSCKNVHCPAFENTDFQNWFAYSEPAGKGQLKQREQVASVPEIGA